MFANNKDMENALIYGAFIGNVILFFPVFLSLDSYTDLLKNKVFFSVYLFKFIKIFGGYLTLHRDGIAIHLGEKKALFVKYADMQNERKKFEITAGFQLYSLRTSIELGNKYFPMLGFYAAAFAQILSRTIYPLFCRNKKFLNLKNGTILTPMDDDVKVTMHLVTVFNQLTVLIAFFKLMLEEIINLWQKKKNTRPLKV